MDLTAKLPRSLDLIFKILKVLGCWNDDQMEGAAATAYHIYGIFVQASMYVVLFSAQLILICKIITDLDKVMDAIYLPLTYLGEAIKMFFFFIFLDKLKAFMRSLSDPIFQPKYDHQKELLYTRTNAFRKTYIVFLAMAAGTIALWALFPLFEVDTTLEGVRKLPVDAWYPFDFNTFPAYQIVYVHQVIAITVNATVNISIDCVSPGCMVYIAAQLEILKDNLENIREVAVDNYKNRKNEMGGNRVEVGETSNCNVDPVLVEELYTAQRHCIEHQLQIYRLSEALSSFFGIPTLAQLGISIFTICATMFQLSLVSPGSLQFMSMVLYQGCMVMELFLFCWYGNEIFLKSMDLLRAVYNSDCMDCPVPFQRNMLIMMARMQFPIKMYAANFFVLSLETFSNVLRSSWSYFAVLRQVHMRNDSK